jgi:pimeloyl-ACP methyl ester carboxylesterase
MKRRFPVRRSNRGGCLRVALLGVLVLFALISVLPYLVPMAAETEVDPAYLVRPYGRFLETENGRIYVEELGPEEGTALVLVHGFGGSTFLFRENADAFAAAGYRVVALDLPGFGLSEKGTGPDYRHSAQAETLGAVMDLVGLDRAIFVGHSMGANVVFHFAQRYPERTVAIVTVAGAPIFRTEWQVQSFFLRYPPFDRAGRVALSHLVNAGRVRDLLESAVADTGTVTDTMVDGYYYRLTSGEWTSALMAMTVARPKNTLDFDLADISVPMLLVAGAEDGWVPLSQSVEWGSGLPNARSELMMEVGHLPMEERPPEFNQLVLDFLDSIE